MALSTYAELQTAIADQLDRADLTSYIPDFIRLAETRIDRDLRHRKMVAIATLTPTSGVVSVPSDFLQSIRVVDAGSYRRELRQIAPSTADIQYPTGTTGTACDFSIVGESIYTYPKTTNDVELTYYQSIPDLATNSTNWLLTTAPGLYYHLSLAYAADFIRNSLELQKQTAAALNILNALNQESSTSQNAHTAYVPKGATP